MCPIFLPHFLYSFQLIGNRLWDILPQPPHSGQKAAGGQVYAAARDDRKAARARHGDGSGDGGQDEAPCRDA